MKDTSSSGGTFRWGVRWGPGVRWGRIPAGLSSVRVIFCLGYFNKYRKSMQKTMDCLYDSVKNLPSKTVLVILTVDF